jgi:hypothetical protein
MNDMTAEQIVATGAVAVGVVVMLVVSLVWEKRKRVKFEERFPPISDAEFMDRCPPGTSPVVALKVRRIVANQLGVEYERIYPSSSFVDDLGC